MDLTNLKTIKTLLQKHNLWAKKSLGQNFLISQNALKKIIETAKITSKDNIIEIGPGLGILTKELLKKTKTVTSIELDKTLFPLLKETLNSQNKTSPKNFTLIHQDALKFTPPKKTYKVVANIPYNITSPLLNHFLQAENKPETLTLLVQKEVAEKICTLSPKMSILSLQVALFGTAKIIKTVKASAFFPQPKVDSAILHITLYKKTNPNFTPTKKAQKILKIAKIAFSQKRKKLKNTLKPLLSSLPQKDLPKIDLNLRPETLSIKEWESLITLLK